MSVQEHRLELSRELSAPRAARHWLADQFAGALDGGRLTTLKLLASELVSNSVLHGHGSIVVRARLDSDRLFVEVTDEGHGFALPRYAEPSRPRAGGWGLALVAGEADRWGTVEGATRVWFELDGRLRTTGRPGVRASVNRRPGPPARRSRRAPGFPFEPWPVRVDAALWPELSCR